MAKPVLTKKDFVRRYSAGEFGNASPTWNSLSEWCLSKYAGLVHIRNRVAGAETWYNVQPSDVMDTWKRASDKCGSAQLYISAMAPEDKKLFQGEVQWGIWGHDLYYTTVAKPMREALAEWSQSVNGILAVCLLRQFLCDRSYEWLAHLLDIYQDHVVEFSTYSVEWGTVPGFNTVFWEVRKY